MKIGERRKGGSQAGKEVGEGGKKEREGGREGGGGGREGGREGGRGEYIGSVLKISLHHNTISVLARPASQGTV